MHPVLFIIHGKPAGQGVMPNFIYGNREVAAPQSKCFFCPACGDIWARMVLLEPGKHSYFTLEWRKCEKHEANGPRAFDLPGSLWLDWNVDYTDNLPPAILQREFDLHIKHYLKWQETIEREGILEPAATVG